MLKKKIYKFYLLILKSTYINEGASLGALKVKNLPAMQETQV